MLSVGLEIDNGNSGFLHLLFHKGNPIHGTKAKIS
jgi:hypothetical protein